jgi:hypothetical protein
MSNDQLNSNLPHTGVHILEILLLASKQTNDLLVEFF